MVTLRNLKSSPLAQKHPPPLVYSVFFKKVILRNFKSSPLVQKIPPPLVYSVFFKNVAFGKKTPKHPPAETQA